MSGVPELDFTLEEFIKELEQEANLAEGLTTQELKEITDMGETWIRGQLRRLKKDGRLIVVRKKVERIDGRTMTVPAYRINV